MDTKLALWRNPGNTVSRWVRWVTRVGRYALATCDTETTGWWLEGISDLVQDSIWINGRTDQMEWNFPLFGQIKSFLTRQNLQKNIRSDIEVFKGAAFFAAFFIRIFAFLPHFLVKKGKHRILMVWRSLPCTWYEKIYTIKEKNRIILIILWPMPFLTWQNGHPRLRCQSNCGHWLCRAVPMVGLRRKHNVPWVRHNSPAIRKKFGHSEDKKGWKIAAAKVQNLSSERGGIWKFWCIYFRKKR